MSGLYLVQMHGRPGAGKTTLARGIGPKLPGIVLDKDIVSTALLRTGMTQGSVGPPSYEVLWDLSASLLGQGFSVVVDSPAFWPVIEERGRGLARRIGADYAMIEITVDDDEEIDRRLDGRDALESNPRTRQALPPGAQEPAGNRLTVDGTRSVNVLVAEAVAYIRGGARSSTPTRNRDWTGRAEKSAANRGIWSGHP